MKIKTSCMAWNTVIWKKQQPTLWEKIFTNYISSTGITSKIYKEIKKPNIKEIYNPT